MNRTGLKLNVFSGLISSFWSGAASIVVVPFYLSSLGPANFGLVVFSTTLLGLFAILDLGFSTSINREVAQLSGSANDGRLRNLLHSLASIYWIVAAVAGGATFVAAGPIARTFLTSSSVDVATTTDAVRLMAALVTLRLPAGVYIGVLMGGQRIVGANLVTLGITTLSTFGTLIVLRVANGGILTFLVWQGVVSAVNVLLLRWMAWRVLSGRSPKRASLRDLRHIWRFSSAVGLTTVIGALLLQLDKLVLARFASLEIVGQYGLAGVASRALLLLIGPVFAAVYPRLTELHSRGDDAAFLDLYDTSTAALTSVLAAATFFFALNAHFILSAWTNSSVIASNIQATAVILIIGTLLNSIMYMPHAVQLAYGNAKIAFLNNAAMMVFMGPAVFLLIPRYGMVGAGVGWLGANIVNVAVGTWLTHRRLLSDSGLSWFARRVVLPASVVAIPAGIVMVVVPAPQETPVARMILSAVLLLIGLIVALARLTDLPALLAMWRNIIKSRSRAVLFSDHSSDVLP